MGYKIIKREMSWGELHEVFLDGLASPVATLTIDRGEVFGAPRVPDINWGALGGRPINIAREFAAAILELAEIGASHIPKVGNHIPK